MTRIAIFQAHSGIDPAGNAEALVAAVEEAAKGGAAMLFTPEMSGLLDRDRERAASHVQHQDEDIVLRAVRDAARRGGDLGSSRVAGAGKRRRQAGQPRAS